MEMIPLAALIDVIISALEAIDLLAERYTQLGKKLHLRHPSPDCMELLGKARGMIEVNVPEDPL